VRAHRRLPSEHDCRVGGLGPYQSGFASARSFPRSQDEGCATCCQQERQHNPDNDQLFMWHSFTPIPEVRRDVARVYISHLPFYFFNSRPTIFSVSCLACSALLGATLTPTEVQSGRTTNKNSFDCS